MAVAFFQKHRIEKDFPCGSFFVAVSSSLPCCLFVCLFLVAVGVVFLLLFVVTAVHLWFVLQ